MVDKELIEIWRNELKPAISLWLLNTNYEEMGEQDKEEFERDFDEILDLALIGMKHKAQLLQERTKKRTETHACDCISRKTGVWLAYTSVPGYMFCKCAACGADILVPYTGRNKPIFNYCPNCGAKMEGEMT